MNWKRNSLAAMLGGAALAFSVPAHAMPTMVMFISDGFGSAVIADNGASDLNPAEGAITFAGPISGLWFINAAGGLSKDQLGSATQPHMDLSVQAVSTGAGMLVISLSDSDFANEGANQLFVSHFGGTAAGTATATAWANDSNTLFATEQQVADIGPLGPGAFSASDSGVASLTAPSSLTLTTVFTHENQGVSSSNQEITVPEPATLGLFALSLIGLGAAARRRRQMA